MNSDLGTTNKLTKGNEKGDPTQMPKTKMKKQNQGPQWHSIRPKKTPARLMQE